MYLFKYTVLYTGYVYLVEMMLEKELQQFTKFDGASEQLMIIEKIFMRLLVAKYWTTIMAFLDALSFLDLFAGLLEFHTEAKSMELTLVHS